MSGRASMIFGAVLTGLLGAASAGAQEGGATKRSATLEEVVVTARRYEESIKNAPVSVAVMDGNYLEDQGITNIQDIIELTPGGVWQEFARAQPGFSLRGVYAENFGNASLESGVQVVVDGIALTKAFMMTPSIFDVQRVEVMRGPQGTSFGRNAIVGLIHFISARPTQEFEAGLDLSAGSLNLFGLDAFISGALKETVSGRLAVHHKQTDGGMEDANTGEALEGTDNISIRGSLLFEPSDTFSAYVKAEYSEDDDLPYARFGDKGGIPWLVSPPYVNEYTEPLDDWKTVISPPPPGGFHTKRSVLLLSSELIWSLKDDVAVTWLTGYQDGDHDNIQDAWGSPEVLRDQLVRNEGHLVSTEIRIDNAGSANKFRWLAGVNYLVDSELRLEDNVSFADRGNGGGRIAPRPETHLQTNGDSETEALGVFGELSFDLTDRWNLTIGGRYSDDTRKATNWADAWGFANAISIAGVVDDGRGDPSRSCLLNVTVDPVTGQNVCGTEANPMGFAPVDLSESWSNFSGKVSLTYLLNDDNTIYALYSEGFKAGGFQHDASSVAALVDKIIDSETVQNFELGWKGAYDRASFALTAFQIEQKNAQNLALIPVGAGNTNVVANFGGSEALGLEFEGVFLLSDNLRIGGSIALYDAELGPGSVIGAAADPVTGEITGEDVSGERPSNAPEQTFVVWAEYIWDLANDSSLRLRADIQHRGDVWGSLSNRDRLSLDGTELVYLRPEINNVGANLDWTTEDGRTTVSLWGRNLTEDADKVTFGPAISAHFNDGAPPRGYRGRMQVGVNLAFRF